MEFLSDFGHFLKKETVKKRKEKIDSQLKFWLNQSFGLLQLYSYHSQLVNGRSLDLLLLSTKSSGVILQMKAPERYLLILHYSDSYNKIKLGMFVLILTCLVLGMTQLKKKKKRNWLSTKSLANPSVCFGQQRTDAISWNSGKLVYSCIDRGWQLLLSYIVMKPVCSKLGAYFLVDNSLLHIL